MDSFNARGTLAVGAREFEIFRLNALADRFDVARLPFSLKVLLENLLRNEGNGAVGPGDIEALASWDPQAQPSREIAFSPARVLLQDFTGVPAIVDLAAMRDAMAAAGGDPARIKPLVPVELVIDHSVQVDAFGTSDAFRVNADLEFERNQERYAFLRWGQTALEQLAVVPPDTGIVHQVNLEYLAKVVFEKPGTGGRPAQLYPDTLVGTDSHTTMVNGLGVLGWGVGGIEAEAAMLGQPLSMLIPRVLGVRLQGQLAEGATATDLVLTVTQILRAHGVVGTFVEFLGPGMRGLPLADRATIGNMSPEFGSTCAIFPVDSETLRYLAFTGRPAEQIELVEAYAREQGLWHEPDGPEPSFSEVLELDLGEVVPSLSGPRRPQDRIALSRAKEAFAEALLEHVPGAGLALHGHDEEVAESYPASDPPASAAPGHELLIEEAPALSAPLPPAVGAPPPRPVRGAGGAAREAKIGGSSHGIDHGHVVIAAITSCTNTSNPSVMIGAGLLARNAVARGLSSKPWVKTSLAPGSKVVSEYLDRAGLTEPLQELGFNLVGYGCTTCIGNSGPLPEEVVRVVRAEDLTVVAVLSGNRNFEGRINPEVKMNYLASPPLCVAYALAGTMDIDISSEPLGQDREGRDVYLREIWPSSREVNQTIEDAIQSDMFRRSYGEVFAGDERWRGLEVPTGDRFAWEPDSTYVRHPPYFEGMGPEPEPVTDISEARILALLGDSVTTDHISPAGSIKAEGPAGRYLRAQGVSERDFNSYGARRGNHEVMMRGTFANIRLKNLLRLEGREALPVGGYTYHLPEGERMSIYDAAMRYIEEGTELIVIGGQEYGSGSSRDWAAKGTHLLGVKAVIAESFERIHRSNLVGMGVLPLQFPAGESAATLQISGSEVFQISGLSEAMGDRNGPPSDVEVSARPAEAGLAPGADEPPAGAQSLSFRARVRIDTPKEAEFYRHGGILRYVLRTMQGAG